MFLTKGYRCASWLVYVTWRRLPCGSTHIATFQLAVIHHSNTTPLSPILLSLQTPVSAHSSRNKRRFPSQQLSQHIDANSHAYQICQPANGRTDEQRENHIKGPWFQPKDYSFNIGIQQKTHLQEYSSRHQESPQQYQDGQVRSLHIKLDSQSVSGVTSSDGIITTPSAGTWFAVPTANV